MLKKITIAIWIVTALLLGVLLVNYYSNRQLIKNYDNGLYQQNELGFLGFTQPYIEHFNKGNIFFRLKNHTKAKQEYQTALNLKPEDPYDCKIRVNYALAYVEPINVKKITKDNYEDTIKICETAKSILAEKGCATKDNTGHYYAAQKLYNEIDDFIKQLRDQFENPTPTPTPSEEPQPTRDPNDPTPTPTPTSKPDGDETPTPTPTPDTGDQNTPTPTPEGGQDQNTPTPTPDGGQNQGTSTPTPTPGGDQGTPTPTPDGNLNGTGTPTPTPGGQNGTGTPTPTGGDQGQGTPTPTGGDQGQGTGTPTPTQGGGGQGQGTPTPTPGDDSGNSGGSGQGPQPTKTPAEKIKEIQDKANKVRGSGDSGKVDYNYGDSASW